MSDMEHVVAEVPRPDGGALRVIRKTYNGSAPFTQLCRLYRDEQTDELRYTKNNVTIRDADLRTVIDALTRIDRKIGQAPEPRREERRPAPRAPAPNASERAAQEELDRVF